MGSERLVYVFLQSLSVAIITGWVQLHLRCSKDNSWVGRERLFFVFFSNPTCTLCLSLPILAFNVSISYCSSGTVLGLRTNHDKRWQMTRNDCSIILITVYCWCRWWQCCYLFFLPGSPPAAPASVFVVAAPATSPYVWVRFEIVCICICCRSSSHFILCEDVFESLASKSLFWEIFFLGKLRKLRVIMSNKEANYDFGRGI